MSDTDDTDALLTCDPGGGITDLLGKTMDEISSQMNSSSRHKSKEGASAKSTRTVSSSGVKEGQLKCTSNNTSSNQDTSLDVSDYFNSDGELVLSGISQFSETTFDVNRTEELKGNSSGDNADCSNSDESSASTVESNTVVPTSSKATRAVDENVKELSVDSQKIRNDHKREPVNKHRSALVKMDKSESVPEEIQSELKRQLFEANVSNPEAQSFLEDNSSHISYGVLNLNLNDLKTFAEGLSLCNLFPQSPKVSTYVPTRNDKGEQVYVRAPNFRTPGGYKPPRNPKKCRDLTDEQIREEVRKMYAFPDAADEDSYVEQEGTGSESKTPENVQRDGESKTNSGDKLKVDFNFLDGTPIPNEFGKGKSGKPLKRKLLPNGGNICGGTVGSIPDLGFGLRSLSSDEVKEPIVEKSVAWTTGTSRESKGGENVVTTNVPSTSNTRSPGGFSFGFGEEDTFSPIKASSVDSTGSNKESSVLFQSQRMMPSPDKKGEEEKSSINRETLSRVSISMTNEPKPAHAQASIDSIDGKLRPDGEPFTPAVHTTVVGSSKTKPSTPKRRLIKKAASKHRGMASPRPGDTAGVASSHSSFPMDSIASDLEKILSEIDIPPDELESLIENFDESDNETPGGAMGFFEGIDTIEGNLVDALSQLKLDSWQPSDAKLCEKYHDERVKREQCEKELRSLQESFLAEKQQNAVLEGTLKRRNVLLMQITVAFNRVCKEWKKFDAENKAAVNKLQHDQKILAAACKHSRERISQYEKELHKTLEMADSFKSKLNDVQNERDASIMLLKETNSELEEKIAKLKEDMELLRTERDATLRALREAQIKLDEGKFSLENMESQIKTLEDRGLENIQKYEELLHVKAQQDSNMMEIMARKNDLENMVVNLRTELELEKSSKEQMRKTFQEESDRKSRMEAERLHDYYNKKVQEILKAATEEASTAESLLKDQMKRASIDSERRLAECKDRFIRELDTLKAKYEAEIEKLKRENLHKQLLISSTVKQLQLGDSTNLDVNLATVNPSRISHKRDILEVLKSHTCPDTSENIYKGSGISNLTKFTLDHLPSIVPIQHQVGTSRENKNSNGLQIDVPFESEKAFVRYKTSTPIDSPLEQHNKAEVNAGGDFRRSKSIPNQAANNNDGNSRPGSEKVCSDKLVTGHSSAPDYIDIKNVLSHFLEAPVKPEKELQMSSILSNGRLSETVVEPALQKCIQELLKSYSDKLNNEGSRNGVSSSTSVVSVHVGVSNNNEHEDVNKNDNECSNNNTDSERNQQCSSTSESLASQLTSRSDSRRSSTKNETSKSQQQTPAHLKPPWK